MKKEKEIKYLDDRLEFRKKLLMEWAFADKRLIKDLDNFWEETREIKIRLDRLKDK